MTRKREKLGSRDAAASLRAVTRTKLHEQIVSQIRDLIQSGQLKHGDRLPPERALSEIFKVSRHSVREAIRILEQQGVLKSRAGSGTFVILDDTSPLTEFLTGAILREKDKIFEIFQFRRMLEPQVAGLAAKNAGHPDIRQMEDIIRNQAQVLDDPVLSGAYDQSFHMALARASGNTVLFDIIERITDIIDITRDESSQTDDRKKRSLKGHETILSAIREGDSEKARKAMEKHLALIERTMNESG